LLVGLLKQIALQTTTNKTEVGDNGDKGEESNNIWDDRIQEFMNNNHNDDDNDDNDNDDDSLNILSFSKEQLEKEEQELLNMAATPIPVKDYITQQQQQQHHQQQQRQRTHPFYTSEDIGANATMTPAAATASATASAITIIRPNRLLVGRLLIATSPSSPSSSSSSPLNIPIELDDRGILRTVGAMNDDDDNNNNNNNNNNKNRRWWSLTSQSVVVCDDTNNSPNIIQITNVISTRTANVNTITLDVGRDGLLWPEQVSRILSLSLTTRTPTSTPTTRTTGGGYGYGYLGGVMEEQEEINKLWPMDGVIMAQTKAKNHFIRAFQSKGG